MMASDELDDATAPPDAPLTLIDFQVPTFWKAADDSACARPTENDRGADHALHCPSEFFARTSTTYARPAGNRRLINGCVPFGVTYVAQLAPPLELNRSSHPLMPA